MCNHILALHTIDYDRLYSHSCGGLQMKLNFWNRGVFTNCSRLLFIIYICFRLDKLNYDYSFEQWPNIVVVKSKEAEENSTKTETQMIWIIEAGQ